MTALYIHVLFLVHVSKELLDRMCRDSVFTLGGVLENNLVHESLIANGYWNMVLIGHN